MCCQPGAATTSMQVGERHQPIAVFYSWAGFACYLSQAAFTGDRTWVGSTCCCYQAAFNGCCS